ncbi:MAG: fibronectin type III domain-containing protein [Thermoguttaceae bacterium]|nr:fibronectin type III domain-containing protein [Thermoguttaceae bacterium]
MKRRLSVKAKTLRFESLENRELLSVNPLGAFPESVPQDSVLQGSADGSYAGAIALALGEPETPSTVVTTDVDAVDAYDGQISLREALGDYSSAGDTITFASSMKGKTITLDAELGQLRVDKNVTIDASELYDSSTETPGVTLSGDDATRIMSTDSGVTTTLKGLTFTRGRTTLDEGGGAILNLGKLMVQDCAFKYNNTTARIDDVTTAYYPGAAIAIGDGGAINANHCVFSGNDGEGTITFATGETSSLKDCLITDNGTYGVYLASGNAQINIEDSVLSDNTNGVYLTSEAGSVVVSNCKLSSNEYGVIRRNGAASVVVENSDLIDNSYYGVAVYNSDAPFVVSNCDLLSNTVGVGVAQSKLSLVDSEVLNNKYHGIDCSHNSYVEATNVVVANNTGGFGAGVMLFGEMTLRNSTITNNFATSRGGGIMLDSLAILNAYNSIIADNTSPLGADVNLYNAYYTSVNAWNVLSSFMDWNSGANQLTYDASQPLFTDAAHGDYTLAENSQAINRGDNSYVTTQTDILGKTRIIDDTVDLGACESGRDPFAITVSSYDPSTRQAILEWGAVPDAATYKLQISKDGGETWVNYRTGLTAPTATVNGLYVGKSYAFRVYGTSVSGAAVSTSYMERTFAPISLSSSSETYRIGEPITVTQSGASNASSTIKWYRATDNGDVEIVTARDKFTYTPTSEDSALKVVAIGTGDSADCSPFLSFTPSLSLSVSDYDPLTRQAVLNWDAIPCATTYKVKISRDGGETWTNYRTNLKTLTATVNGLYLDTSCVFRVYGVSNLGRTIMTPYAERAFAPISLSSLVETYSAGTPIVVTQLGPSTASSMIQWYYATEDGDVEITEARGSLTYAPASANFEIKVVATGTGDSEGCLSTLAFTPTQSEIAPFAVSSYNPSTRQAVLEWSAVPGAKQYRLQISKDGGETWMNYRTGLTTTTATANGLYVGKSYGFRVYWSSSSGTTPANYYEITFSPSNDSNSVLDDAFAEFFDEELFEV